MKSLRELEADAQLDVPLDMGIAIKAWRAGAAGPEQQRAAYQFVVNVLAAKDRLSFAMPDDPNVMGWRQGRRFVGLQIETIANAPMEVETPAEPKSRTMTERAARRAKPRG